MEVKIILRDHDERLRTAKSLDYDGATHCCLQSNENFEFVVEISATKDLKKIWRLPAEEKCDIEQSIYRNFFNNNNNIVYCG